MSKESQYPNCKKNITLLLKNLRKVAQSWLDTAKDLRESDECYGDYGIGVRPLERTANTQEFCGNELLEIIQTAEITRLYPATQLAKEDR